MIEGWHDEDYLILFTDESEASAAAERYAIAKYLPGFTLAGLAGWDDFILTDVSGKSFSAPTVPLLRDHLRPLQYQIDVAKIRNDPRFAGRIKWHVMPLVFGGDPRSKENITWLAFDQHADAVKWWNDKYQELKRG